MKDDRREKDTASEMIPVGEMRPAEGCGPVFADKQSQVAVWKKWAQRRCYCGDAHMLSQNHRLHIKDGHTVAHYFATGTIVSVWSSDVL